MTNTTLNLATAIAIAFRLDTSITTLPKEQLEGLSLKVIRHKFGAWFTTTVSKLMEMEDEQAKKKYLGSAVDYRTRAVQWTLKKDMNLEFDEEFITRFRYAIMNCLRDEAFARSNPSDRFTSPHVVKGREDEQQVLVLHAMEELDDVTKSFAPVFRDSKLKEASESQFANDSKELVATETEAEVDRLLRIAGIAFGNGETPDQQLQTLSKAHDTLTTHKVWSTILKTPAEHLDRLKLAQSLESQLHAASTDRVKAHQYYIAGDEVTVPRITAHSVPTADAGGMYQRTYCFVLTLGWNFVNSGYITATSFDEARAAVLEFHVPDTSMDGDAHTEERLEVHLA
ncbi:hypothetical protein [Deinococcus soli (ex Cha et al. 2016)]|uniref:hypothetical protein n=1 Tax=Deinococcus soli (ex Cha et al. 2016) TaxID=1309411 RepID=UPI00166E27C2|nr:hypothetical protein [Deinococcus soli (ex Cha et al. 2016)]GGB73742.1 hypothetical protein GCM10008019_32430 [Deinococcus soli (ex Cha et al. 2016)]